MEGIVMKIKDLLGSFFGALDSKKNTKKVPSADTKLRAPASPNPYLEESNTNEDYDEILDEGGVKNRRPDILNLLQIPDNYPVPDDIMLSGDLQELDFMITQPEGYSQKQVDSFVRVMVKSLKWFTEHLQKRNEDVAVLATQLDKTEADLHNVKVSNELAEGLSVLTGESSTSDNDLMEAQIRIAQLQDELETYKKGSKGITPAETSKYEDAQNQLALLQLENTKLKKQLKRVTMEKTAAEDGSIDLDALRAQDDDDTEEVLDFESGSDPITRIPVSATPVHKNTIDDAMADEAASEELSLPMPDLDDDGETDDLPDLELPEANGVDLNFDDDSDPVMPASPSDQSESSAETTDTTVSNEHITKPEDRSNIFSSVDFNDESDEYADPNNDELNLEEFED
jgi:uncharacterized small protein (DUF1192 family)